MKNLKVNQNLIRKLQTAIDKEQLRTLVKRYKNHVKNDVSQQMQESMSKQQNSIAKKHNRLNTSLKQKLLQRRKESQKDKPSTAGLQSQMEGQQKQFQHTNKANQGKPIKDKAVFVNMQQIPYLHSTDLLNHLYKKPSPLEQQNNEMALYNPPANNPYALTKVKYLSIYYCKMESLRDMGTGWSNLVQLSVYFGRLRDLSGLNAFPSLEYLHCPFNSVSTISDVMFHPTLVSVDLESNQIADLAEVQHLFTVQNLQYLNLSNNPVYMSKQNKRKIHQKFDKIIDLDNTKLQEYVHQKQRQIWELQNIQGVECCNNILRQFFSQTRNDEIIVQIKYQMTSNNFQHGEIDFETFQANFNKITEKDEQKQKEKEQKELKIEYFPPEIPEDKYFEEMIMRGDIQDEEVGAFCEEKIYLTPLTDMIDKNQVYIGPVLDKYLQNKLYFKDEMAKANRTINMEKKQGKDETESVKPKTISRLSMTAFSSKGFSSMGSSQMMGQSGDQGVQKAKQFATTASSFSTNCTNMNNTSTSFGLRRSRLAFTNSKQKPMNKISLLKNPGQSFNLLQNVNLEFNSLHRSSLAKQSRMMLGKSLKKELKEGNGDMIEKAQLGNQQMGNKDESVGQKQGLTMGLKRKGFLGYKRRQKESSMTKKQIQS